MELISKLIWLLDCSDNKPSRVHQVFDLFMMLTSPINLKAYK